MNKIFVSLLLAQSLLTPALTFARLTEAEQAFAQKCHDNVTPEKKLLSAATALECVKRINADNAALLNKLRDEDTETETTDGIPRTVRIVSRNNALVDLKNIVTNDTGKVMADHLMRVLKESNCSLCAMELGPRPENTFEWVGKEAGSSLDTVKKSVRTWEGLGEIRLKSLSSAEYSYNKVQWNAQTIPQRYGSLSSWAEAETDKLAAIYGNRSLWARFLNKKPDPQLLAVLSEDLTANENFSSLTKLHKLEMDIGRMGDEKKTAAPSPYEKKSKELSGAAKTAAGLKTKSEAEQAAYLGETFDQTGLHKEGASINDMGKPKPGEKPDSFVFQRLGPEQIEGLSGRLLTADNKGNLRGPIADEIRDTKAGDEILAFYKNPEYAKAGTNRLNLSFSERPKGEFGGWSPSAKTLNLNSELVNDWMEKNEVTPKQLFEGDPSKNPHLRELSQYLAPTFVHESTHQRQGAKAAASGIDFQGFLGKSKAPYQFEMETEAFSMDSSFIAEKLQKRGPAYTAKLDPFDKENAALFIEKGVEGIRLENHRNYTHLDSFEGSAAKEFDKAASIAKGLKSLETRYKTAPGSLKPEEEALMWKMKTAMNSRFKWYTITYADSNANKEKINGWRDEIKSKLYTSKSIDTAAPPELL